MFVGGGDQVALLFNELPRLLGGTKSCLILQVSSAELSGLYGSWSRYDEGNKNSRMSPL